MPAQFARRRTGAKRSRRDFAGGLLLVLVAGFALGGCVRERTAPRRAPRPERPSLSARGYPLADLRIERAGRVLLELEVEIAEAPETRGRGLMGVESLGKRSGMAFLFGRPNRSSFFMKNVTIPLDIAFWDEMGRIVDGFTMQPCAGDPCSLYPAGADYVGAIEMNGGLLGESRIDLGDVVKLRRRSRGI